MDQSLFATFDIAFFIFEQIIIIFVLKKYTECFRKIHYFIITYQFTFK